MRKEKKSNPFSSSGLDTFARLNAELSAKREYFARKKCVPKDAVRFLDSRKGWIPVVMKNTASISLDGGSVDSIVEPVEKKSGRKKLKCSTSNIGEKSFKARMGRMDCEATKPMKLYYGSSQRFNAKMRKRAGFDGNFGAIGMLIVLFFLVFYGKLSAILCTCAWWYATPKFRRDENGVYRSIGKKSGITLMLDVESMQRKKMVMDRLLDRKYQSSGALPMM